MLATATVMFFMVIRCKSPRTQSMKRTKCKFGEMRFGKSLARVPLPDLEAVSSQEPRQTDGGSEGPGTTSQLKLFDHNPDCLRGRRPKGAQRISNDRVTDLQTQPFENAGFGDSDCSWTHGEIAGNVVCLSAVDDDHPECFPGLF